MRRCYACALPEQCSWGPRNRYVISLHHVVPRAVGGSDDPSNLVPLCSGCHAEVHRLYSVMDLFPVMRERANAARRKAGRTRTLRKLRRLAWREAGGCCSASPYVRQWR